MRSREDAAKIGVHLFALLDHVEMIGETAKTPDHDPFEVIGVNIEPTIVRSVAMPVDLSTDESVVAKDVPRVVMKDVPSEIVKEVPSKAVKEQEVVNDLRSKEHGARIATTHTFPSGHAGTVVEIAEILDHDAVEDKGVIAEPTSVLWCLRINAR